MDRLEMALLIILSLVTLAGLYLGFMNPEFFTNRFMMEDGEIENATVVLLLGACLLVLGRWIRHRKLHSVKFTIISWLIVVAFFFVAGEEVSWGQRLFDLETTEYFKQHNAQEEINLHNLVVGDVKINKLFFGLILTTIIMIYLLLVPVLHHRVKTVRRWLDGWYIPIPRWRHTVAYLLLILLISLIPASKNWELLEFGSVLIFFLILRSPANYDFLQVQPAEHREK